MPRRNPAHAISLERIGRLGASQGGACTHAQAQDLGLSAGAIRCLVDGRRWQRIHRGIYLLRPGEADLNARMWAGHLRLGPASVVGVPAAGHYWGLLDGGLARDEALPMLVPEHSRRSAEGITVRRIPNPAAWAHPARGPPVLAVEHAVLEIARTAATDDETVDAVLRACRLRLTTPGRILSAAKQRPRLRRRELVLAICDDAAVGVTSPLEVRYARRVERAHGLPRATRQARSASVGGSTVYRDVLYPGQA